jgi:hypothetical protein
MRLSDPSLLKGNLPIEEFIELKYVMMGGVQG